MSRSHAPLACAAALVLALATPAAAADDLCARALTALGSGGAELACAATANGVAIAPDADRAAQLSRLGVAGEGRFTTYFNRDIPRYAILESIEIEGMSDPRAALETAGFEKSLIWLSQEQYARQVSAGMRASAEAAARRQGLDDQAVAAVVDRAVAAGRFDRATLDAREAQVVPHELGHSWFIRAFWPDHQSGDTPHYGGPGPDWLDEIAAMLMESGDGAEERRKIFRDVYQGRSAGAFAAFPVSDLIDLPRFLSRDHPVLDDPGIRPTESAPGGVVTMRVLTPGNPSVSEAALYYPQGRMFADFLLDRAGDPKVFEAIAEAVAEGESFERWLSTHGPSRNLPGSILELDEA